MILIKSRLAAAMLLAFMCSTSLFAQETTGSMRGFVVDPSGARVPRASVSAIQIETGLRRQTESDPRGSYMLVLLPIGHYRLEVSAPGFQRFVQSGIRLSVNQVATVPVRLVLGSPLATVEVTSKASLVQSTNDLGETVHERDIVDLPLNGRNFTQLGLLLPGAAPLTQGLLAAGGTLRAGQSYAINGMRPESNNFLIDGTENNNSVNAGFVLRPPPDAIAEFRILTNTAPAEFGHDAGSTTNIVTRSGSNQFHGDAWEFLRNDIFDARNFFSTSVEPLKQNQFGGTVGGPIQRDRTFFFVYYEGFRNRQGETQLAPVPSVAERAGDFSALCPTYNSQGFCTDTYGDQAINYITGQPYPFNTIPSNQINPVSSKVLSFYPLPNAGPNLFSTTQTLDNGSDQFGTRVDRYLSANDTLSFHYLFWNGSQVDPLSISGANVPGFPVGENFQAQSASIVETHSFSPAVVNVAQLSYLRNKLLAGEALNHASPSSLGFQYSPTLAMQSGPPFIEVGGYASVGDPITGPSDDVQNTYSFTDSVEWTHGQHDAKFGGEIQRDQLNTILGIASNGFFVFAPFPVGCVNPGSCTANFSFADYLVGQPVVFLQGGGDLERGLRATNENLYAEDSFKATPHLTLNVGLRYELPSPYSVINNQTALFRPGAQSKIIPSAPPGLLYPGDPGVPSGLVPREYTAFAPRVGFAWDPTGSGRWAIRSAYGIFYDPYYNGEGGPLQAPESAPPWFKTIQEQPPTSFASPIPAGTNPFAPNFNSGIEQALTLLTVDPSLRLPYAQDWNFSIERSFGQDWLWSVGYVGTKGTHLPRFIEDNPAVYVPDQSTAANVNQRRIYSGCTLASPNSCTYGSIGLIASIANSDYNALQSSLRKTFSHGLTFLASYTYSKTLDDVSSLNITGSSPQSVAGENDLAQNPFDLAAEYGRSLFDARHRLVLSYEWQPLFWRQGGAWYRNAFGNWQVNGIFAASTGTPFTVYDSSDPSLQGQSPEISGFYSDRPNLVGSPNNGPGTASEWFNTSAFQRVSQPGAFGNAGRNIVQGPGITEWDFSVFKDFAIKESKTLQFRAEAFNILNNVNFGLPNNDISSPTFGQVQSALPPREIQLALKLLF